MTKIAIFDYGAGNLFSLKSALERNGAESVDIIYDLKELSKFDGLVAFPVSAILILQSDQ